MVQNLVIESYGLYFTAGVNSDIHTKLIKIGILWLENGSNGYLLCKISYEKAEPRTLNMNGNLNRSEAKVLQDSEGLIH